MDDTILAARLLDVVEHDIVPLTREGVQRGNKLFGAAILRKADLSLVVAATNRETQNPLWHAEISALNDFYSLPTDERPVAGECIFLATHEPCPLCLSAITWAGFDNFFYLFSYGDTRDAFNIPHDLRILEEVFDVKDGAYRRQNQFWTSRSIAAMVAESAGPEQEALETRVRALADIYAEMSSVYQASKAATDIALN